jgi:Flp pilus assembly protein TadD
VLNAEFANVPARARASYDKAIQLAQAGNNKAAVEQLKQAISEYPEFMLAFNELGVQYLRLGELDKADEALAKARKLAPDSATPLLTHGVLLAVQGNFNLAVTELQTALKQKDQSAIGHLYLGQSLAILGRYADAESHLTRAIDLGGDEVKDAHRFLGAIYFQRGEREKGVAEFETYLRLAPKAKDAEQVRNMIRPEQAFSKPRSQAILRLSCAYIKENHRGTRVRFVLAFGRCSRSRPICSWGRGAKRYRLGRRRNQRHDPLLKRAACLAARVGSTTVHGQGRPRHHDRRQGYLRVSGRSQG